MINEAIEYQKPFLKWVGGKTQIMKDIMGIFPNEMNNYHEIFLGGGSVLLALLTLKKDNKINIKGKLYAYDYNKKLINVYKSIQTDRKKLIEFVNKYKNEYESIEKFNTDYPDRPEDKKSNEYKKISKRIKELRKPNDLDTAIQSKECYYYYLRNKFNTMDSDSIEYSALFIVLNKLCFRGVYREGPKGLFNVPFGNYKTTPEIIKENEIDKIYELIKDVEFIHSDFNDSIPKVMEGDFTYLDPPYAPVDEKSFVGYTIDGFNSECHEKLFERISDLNKKKIKFAMSNAKVKLVDDKFKNDNYKYCEIIAKRSINSKNPDSVAKEVIIYN